MPPGSGRVRLRCRWRLRPVGAELVITTAVPRGGGPRRWPVPGFRAVAQATPERVEPDMRAEKVIGAGCLVNPGHRTSTADGFVAARKTTGPLERTSTTRSAEADLRRRWIMQPTSERSEHHLQEVKDGKGSAKTGMEFR